MQSCDTINKCTGFSSDTFLNRRGTHPRCPGCPSWFYTGTQ